jgi:hypothetical protein
MNSKNKTIYEVLAALFLIGVILGGISLILGPIAGILAALLIIGILVIPYEEN